MKIEVQDLNKAHESIMNEKYYHLSVLSAIADKLIHENKDEYAKQIKEAIDFIESYLK